MGFKDENYVVGWEKVGRGGGKETEGIEPERKRKEVPVVPSREKKEKQKHPRAEENELQEGRGGRIQWLCGSMGFCGERLVVVCNPREGKGTLAKTWSQKEKTTGTETKKRKEREIMFKVQRAFYLKNKKKNCRHTNLGRHRVGPGKANNEAHVLHKGEGRRQQWLAKGQLVGREKNFQLC